MSRYYCKLVSTYQLMTFSIRGELRLLLTIQIDPSILKKLQGMDPHQRVVLEVGYEACHHAGYSKGKLMNKIGWSLSLVASSDSIISASTSPRWRLPWQQLVPSLHPIPCCSQDPQPGSASRTVFGMVSEVSGATGAAASINSNRFSFCFSECYTFPPHR